MHGPPHLVPDADADAAGPPDVEGDAGWDAPDAPYPAFGYTVPQVSAYGETPVISNAVFVPIVFPGEGLATEIDAFMQAVGPSSYWSTIGNEYGVEAASATALITEPSAPPANVTDEDIQAFLTQAIETDPRLLALGANLDAGIQPANPNAAPPSNAVYVVFYPSSTTITTGSLGASCDGFGGYHSSFQLANGAIAVYAVIPRCTNFNDTSGIDFVTTATSHELIEACTDPSPISPAFEGTDTNHFVWSLTLGSGEVGDMCSFLLDANVHPSEPALAPFLVQRIWSNASAAAGNDPCVPKGAGESAYFNSIPVGTEVPFTDQGQSYQTLGTKIPVGQSAMVTLDLVSNGPSPPWDVQLLDYGAAYDNPPILDLKIVGASSGTNGQTVTVQITPLQAGPASLLGISPYFIYSTAGDVSSFWVGAVTN